MLNNIKLSTRIYVQQIIIVIALIGLGVFSLSKLQFINDASTELAEQDMPMLILNGEIKDEAKEHLFHMLQALNIQNGDMDDPENTEHLKEISEKLNKNGISLKEKLAAFQAEIDKSKAIEKEKEMLDLLKEFQTTIDALNKEIAALFELDGYALKTSNDEERIYVQDQIESIYGNVDALTKQFYDISANDINRSVKSVGDYTSQLLDALKVIVITVSLVGVLMMVLTGISLRSLRQSVGVISSSVQQVATAASQSGSAISMVSDGAKRQADSISQAVTAVEQSMSVLGEVAKSAEEANTLARTAGSVVKSGKEKMDGMVRVVGRIQENSNKVNKITEIIAGIANQTNMLALNAAIEAARAGEHGKGFAVVADQVKSLAENSKNSVDDIVTLIEQAKLDAVEAVTVANNVNAEMEKILESSKTTERMMINITTAMEEQVSTTEELSRNMDSLRGIGNSNANAAEEITETIIELSRIASDTNTEIKKFNI